MGEWKKDVTPLLIHWSHVFLASTYWVAIWYICLWKNAQNGYFPVTVVIITIASMTETDLVGMNVRYKQTWLKKITTALQSKEDMFLIFPWIITFVIW